MLILQLNESVFMATLKIYNDIVDDTEQVMLAWNGLEGTTFKDVDTFISELGDGDNSIDLTINCRGGDYEQGVAIYDALRASGKDITAKVVGQCSSIATLFLLAAKKGSRKATPNATILIHDPYIPAFTLADAYGAGDLQRIADDLQSCTERLLDIYVDRTGADRERLRDIMAKDTPMSAKEALELGFIDEILVPKSALNRKLKFSSSSMNNSIKNAFIGLASALGFGIKAVGMVLETATGEELTLEKESGDPAVGDKVESPDGEYVMPDGSTIVVEESVITEIRPAEEEAAEEVTPAADPEEAKVEDKADDEVVAEEETPEEEADNSEVEELKALLAEKDARIAELEAEVERLKGEVKTNDERETLNIVAMAGGKEWLKRAKSDYRPKPDELAPRAKKSREELAPIRDITK